MSKNIKRSGAFSLIIKAQQFQSAWELPGNKSFSNRALVVAALSKKMTRFKSLSDSTDVSSMLAALSLIGVEVKYEKSDVIINGQNTAFLSEKKSTPLEVFSGDGGTTTRFLLPLLARCQRPFILRPSGGMIKRPMSELIDVLKKLNVEIYQQDDGAIFVQGPIDAKNQEQIVVDCQRSTQFLSAMMLSTFDLNVKIVASNLNSSYKYVEQTQSVITEVCKKKEIDVPVDFSSASYPLTLAAIDYNHKEMILSNCFNVDTYQADSIYLDFLKSQGAKFNITPEKGLVFSPEKLAKQAFEFDGSPCPDLVPSLCVYAAFCQGVSRIYFVESLRHKECDRIDEVVRIFSKFDIKVNVVKKESSEAIEIFGMQKRNFSKAVKYHAPEDHRMIMIASLLMATFCGGEILNEEHVNKSYPSFFSFLSR